MSELALQRIREAKQHRLTRLDLGNCGLTELPDELFELDWLEELMLCKEGNFFDFETNLNVTFKSENEGTINILTHISHRLSDLKKLKVLLLNSDWGHRSTLKNLDFLEGLIHLKYLNFSHSLIKDIKGIRKLSNLHYLICNDTEVEDLTPLKNLSNLFVFSAQLTRIKDLKSLNALNNLEYIDLSISPISNIEPLKNLKNLHYLQIWKTGISDLKPLSELNNLFELRLDKTLILDLTPLANLQNLRKLIVSETKISDLNPLKNLVELKHLEINSTQVSDLIPIIRLFKDTNFVLHCINCPLTSPPREIVEQGNSKILQYFRQIIKSQILSQKEALKFWQFHDFSDELDKQINNFINDGKQITLFKSTVELYEAKLIIVGEGGTGKTTLYEKLKDPTHQVGNTPETHGINIHEGLEIKHPAINNQLFHANLWDFGGQELQYMTHQFFLTPRALYVLMMDARKEAPNLAYWLKIISLLGKDSQDSTEKVRLLLVFNKRQNSTGTPPQYQDTLQYYQDHLDVQYIEVDLGKDEEGFKHLKETIERKLVTLPIVKSQLPRKWKDVREDLRQEAKTRTHISTERLSEICSKHSITDEQDQLQLSDYLHKLGSLLHFQNDKTLINWVFLSPEWVVEGVYGFLKNDLIAKQNGKFTGDDFFKILFTTKNDKNYTYTRPDSAKILQLMTKNNFDICYESANGNYVAAQLLPENAPPPYKWHTDSGALKFRYQYPVMPKGLMSRLIVRLSEYLEIMDGVEVVWKKGAILSIKTDKNNPNSVCRILMKEDDAESKDGLRQIILEVMGDPATHRKHALQRVREEVESLHKRWFRSIKADEMVPCCCSVCRNSTQPELYKLEKLLKLREKRAETVCYSSGEDISIFHLLEGVYEDSEIKNMGSRGGFREY